MFDSFKIGQRVVFQEKAPEYDRYKGHEFLITEFLLDDDERPIHDFVKLKCETSSAIQITEAIETSSLKLVSNVVESFSGAGVVATEAVLAIATAGLEIISSIL